MNLKARPQDPPGPEVWLDPELIVAVAAWDWREVFRLLTSDYGFTQRRIAALCGLSPAELSKIMHGKKAVGPAVMRGIVEGLGIPRRDAGLACDQCAARAEFLEQVAQALLPADAPDYQSSYQDTRRQPPAGPRTQAPYDTSNGRMTNELDRPATTPPGPGILDTR